MFDFLKASGNQPADVKAIRQQILLFIKDRLKKAEGGEGSSIKGLQLFIAAGPDQHLYEAAVFMDEPDRFRKAEVQRIADDFAIDLPSDWTLEILFEPALPDGAVQAPNMPVALGIVTRRPQAAKTPDKALIRVLSGEAEQENYEISPASGRIYIGRDKRAQAADGFFRDNTIAFPSTSNNSGNRFISRSHAHIDWDKASGCFVLYADEGGIPPRNKIKVQRGNGQQFRLQTVEIGHHLERGDQIVLGESVVLEFDYLTEDT